LERGGPGAWLDPDMLEVGNGGLTYDESKTHFALWALAKSPLLLGNDLHTMNQAILQVITNRHLIALHQDALVKQITCFIGCSSNSKVKWSAFATRVPLTGDSVVIIVNWSNASLTNLTFAAHAVGVVPMPTNKVVQVMDLWTDTIVGNFNGPGLKTIPVVPTVLQSHSCALYRLSVRAAAAPTATTSNATIVLTSHHSLHEE
jgi:alpha-galactosidase